MKAQEILEETAGQPIESVAEYTEKRSVLLAVARLRSEEDATKWPFLNPHQHCLRMIRKLENANGELSGSELLNCYEEFASAYVNDSRRW
jgi:hypothetical protein